MACAGGDEDAVRTMIANSTEGIELVAVSGAACTAWGTNCERSALSPTHLPLQVDGTTPLWIASARGHRGIVDLLLASGADVSAVHVGALEVLDVSFPRLDL